MTGIDKLFERQLVEDSIVKAYREGGGRVDVFIGASFVWNGGGNDSYYTCHMELHTADGKRLPAIFYFKSRHLYRELHVEETDLISRMVKIYEMDREIVENAIDYAEMLKREYIGVLDKIHQTTDGREARELDITINGRSIDGARKALEHYAKTIDDVQTYKTLQTHDTGMEAVSRAGKNVMSAKNDVIASDRYMGYYTGNETDNDTKREIKIYTSPSCPSCHSVKHFLKENKVEFEEIDVSASEDASLDSIKKSGQMGVPVTDIDGKIIVGYNILAIKKALGL